MNNPMIILIGLAIAAVGTLVAVNVVLPMLARAEAQAIASEANTLAGAIWEAKRQNITAANRAKVSEIRYLLSGWTCDRVVPATSCRSDKAFDNSQVDGGFVLDETGFTITFKEGATDTCVSTAGFLNAMNSPFFDVYDKKGGTKYSASGGPAATRTECAKSSPVFFITMK